MDEQTKLDEIINGCRRNSDKAFSELVDMFGGRLYGYFYRLTGNTENSNDLLGELFLRLVEKIHLYKQGSFEKWLFAIASNLFRDWLRQRYRREKLLKGKVEMLQADTTVRQSQSRTFDKLQDALAQLDKETAELLMLRFYSQLSFKELAEMRSEPIGTTLSKVHRGLKKLKRIMEQLDD